MENVITIIKEFDGIIGAILGSVITLIVTDILKSKGKLKIYLMKGQGNFYYNVMGFHQTYRESKEDKLSYYKYELELNIYNSSDSFKFIRDIKLIVSNGDKFILEDEIMDEETRVYNQHFSHIDPAKIYNIAPKIVMPLKLSFSLSDKEYKSIDTKKKVKFEISYIDDKNKNRKIKIYDDYLVEPKIQPKKEK